MKHLGTILNKSPGLDGDMADSASLRSLRLVKVAYFSETMNRVKGTVQPGRNGFFPFLRVQYIDATGAEMSAYAQLRCMFKAVYSEGSSPLVFLVRWVRCFRVIAVYRMLERVI